LPETKEGRSSIWGVAFVIKGGKMSLDSCLKRDANRIPLFHAKYPFVASKTITFNGATVDDIGDYDGTGDPFTIFTVTGEVLVNVVAVCKVNLAGVGATIEIGVTGDTAEIIAQTTATDIKAGELWHDASPDTSCESASVITEKIIVGGADIIGNIETANITSGSITFICGWFPISSDGNVVAA
jgi:hypothetical protein